MHHLSGPRILAATLVLFYAVFWVWYGGAGKPLSAAEVDRYMARLDALAGGTQGALGLRAPLEAWARADDGREFFMVNLVDDPADMAAAEAYNRVILPALFARAGHPVFLSRPIARYRSMRDMLDMITGPDAEKIRHLKEASVSKTHVFPTHIGFSLISVRFLVAFVFAALGLALHFMFRPFGWYAR